MDIKEKIARRVAKEFKDGDYVNLGIGPAPEPGEEEKNLANAGGLPITLIPGAACFDSATSFGIIQYVEGI